MNSITPRNSQITIAAASIITIFLIILSQSRNILYDEVNFIPNIHFLQQFGFTKRFLLMMRGSPGPTYAVMHYAFLDLTHYKILYIRYTNFGFLLLLLFFIYLNAKLLQAKDPLIITSNFIFIPMVWVSCGLALTEVPAMLFAMVSFYLLLKSFLSNNAFFIRLTFSIIAGLFLSFAILGRSFFLMISVAVPIFILVKFLLGKFDSGKAIITTNIQISPLLGKRKSLLLLGCFFICSLIIPLLIFRVWGGLAPPNDTNFVGANNLSLNPWYGVLSFCYGGFVSIILAPNWFIINKRTIYMSLFISLVFQIINFQNGYFKFAPFMSFASKVLSSKEFDFYQKVIPGFIILLAFHFILSTLVRIWQYRSDHFFAFLGLIILSISFSDMKVTAQFSSRYVAQITPFFLLIFIRFERTTWKKLIRITIAAVLGCLSLYGYYFY